VVRAGKSWGWGPLGSRAFRYDARLRGDVVDLPEALGYDLLMFVKLVAYEEFGEDLPFMSG
jgi:hypothetical protein